MNCGTKADEGGKTKRFVFFPFTIEDVVVQELATLCLASMSIDYTSKIDIFEKGGLGPLVSLLSSPDPDVQKNSIECISNLIQVVYLFYYLQLKYILRLNAVILTS